MFTFLMENIGTMVVVLIITGILAAIVVKIIRDRRNGKCAGCSCGCENCPSQPDCAAK